MNTNLFARHRCSFRTSNRSVRQGEVGVSTGIFEGLSAIGGTTNEHSDQHVWAIDVRVVDRSNGGEYTSLHFMTVVEN